MGQFLNKTNQETLLNNGHYHYIKTVIDPKYGEGILIQENNGNLILLKEYTFTNQKDYEKLNQKIIKRQQIQKDNIIQLLGSQLFQEKNMCSTTYRVQLMFQYTSICLQTLFDQYHRSHQNLTEKQLWNFMIASINGLAELQKMKIKHSNLRLVSFGIFQDKFHGQIVKVSDSQFFSKQNCLATVLLNESESLQGYYLSPELTKAVFEANYHPIHNPYKSDVYTLGMLFLSLSLLTHLDSCYNYLQGKIIISQLNYFINLLTQQYSSNYQQLIQNLVTYEEYQRMDFIQLQSKLSNYKYNDDSSPQIDWNQIDQFQQDSINDQDYLKQDAEYSSSPIVKEIQNSMTKPQFDQQLMINENEIKQKRTISSIQKSNSPLNSNNNLNSYQKQDNLQQLMVNKSIGSLLEQKQSFIQSDQFLSQSFQSIQRKRFQSQIYPDGSKYEGEYDNSMRNGYGRLIYQNGGYYEGQWKNDQINGFGKLFYRQNVLAYEGFWVEGKFQGQGTLYNDTEQTIKMNSTFEGKDLEEVDNCWIKYAGTFQDDQKHGYGTLYFEDGSYYQGEFLNDCAHGDGKFIMRNGRILVGIWKFNKLQSL